MNCKDPFNIRAGLCPDIPVTDDKSFWLILGAIVVILLCVLAQAVIENTHTPPKDHDTWP